MKQLLRLAKFLWSIFSTPSGNTPIPSNIFFKDFKTPISSNFVNGCFQEFPIFWKAHFKQIRKNLLSFNILIFMLRNINYLSIFSTVTHRYTLAQCKRILEPCLIVCNWNIVWASFFSRYVLMKSFIWTPILKNTSVFVHDL